MSGTRWVLISKDNKVYKISQPRNWIFKPMRELAGEEVLEVILYYDIKNRKPNKLLMVDFDRINLSEEGSRIQSDEDDRKVLHNFFEFGLTTIEELAKKEVLAIPVAPIIPSTLEKEALYTYLREKLEVLADEAPIIVENRIKYLKQKHMECVSMVREASKLRK